MKQVMKRFTDILRSLAPTYLLEAWRERKRRKVRNELAAQEKAGISFTTEQLLGQLRGIGIQTGDHIMVHSSLSKMGHISDGPQGVVDALLQAVGHQGTLCMPSSPVKKLQFDHMRDKPTFDVRNTPSAMGAISEVFRNMDDTLRSLHPTEPVCAQGALAKEFVQDHEGQLTPYNAHSPWKKLMDAGGKILYVGVTLDNAGTHLHTLEDAVDFRYPVYHDELFEAQLINENGQPQTMRTKVHNPEFSRRRKCDELIPYFEAQGVLQRVKLGRADCLLLNAEGMFTAMTEGYRQQKITMYTPHGENITGYDD